jgi:hypothetical protein
LSLKRCVIAGARVLALQGVGAPSLRRSDEKPVQRHGAKHARKVEPLRRGLGQRPAPDDLKHLLEWSGTLCVAGAVLHTPRPLVGIEGYGVGRPTAVPRRARDDYRSQERQGVQLPLAPPYSSAARTAAISPSPVRVLWSTTRNPPPGIATTTSHARGRCRSRPKREELVGMPSDQMR